MTDVQSSTELNGTADLLPPPPGTFVDRDKLIQHVGDFAVSHGYVVTIKQSKRDKVVMLGCDRGGVYRNRRKPAEESSTEHSRKRKTGSRLTKCPFEAVGKKDDGLWVLTIKNGTHNHEPFKDMSEHPSASRFIEREVLLVNRSWLETSTNSEEIETKQSKRLSMPIPIISQQTFNYILLFKFESIIYPIHKLSNNLFDN